MCRLSTNVRGQDAMSAGNCAMILRVMCASSTYGEWKHDAVNQKNYKLCYLGVPLQLTMKKTIVRRNSITPR